MATQPTHDTRRRARYSSSRSRVASSSRRARERESRVVNAPETMSRALVLEIVDPPARDDSLPSSRERIVRVSQRMPSRATTPPRMRSSIASRGYTKRRRRRGSCFASRIRRASSEKSSVSLRVRVLGQLVRAHLGVVPSHRRRGLGSYLMRVVQSRAARAGVLRIQASVDIDPRLDGDDCCVLRHTAPPRERQEWGAQDPFPEASLE